MAREAGGSRTGVEGAAEAQPLRLLVVDDHDVVHWGFRMMFGGLDWVERCVAARDGDSAVELAERWHPHVALVDLFVGSESGTEVCERLRGLARPPAVLLISGAGHISGAASRAAGASGFVSKDLPADEIARAVRVIGLGGEVFPELDVAHGGSPLSGREREVLGHLASGSTNREIADTLFLSPHTVKEHVSAVYRKLEVRNRAEAVQKGQRLGLLA